MAAPGLPTADIHALLAALAASQQQNAGQPPQQGAIPGYPPHTGVPGVPGVTPNPPGLPFNLPQPTSTGSVDLSSIRPVNTGSVSIADALNKARNFAAEKGIAYDSRGSRDPARPYRRSRSRSRSPRRDQYNSYRDDRRDETRRYRSRSRSPGRDRYGRGYGRDRSPPRRDDDDSEVISIDSNLVGLVIGRSGENLRRVEKETGARIQFITPPDHKGPTRQCRISGTLRARSDAKREIDRVIEENNQAQPRDTRGPARAPPPPKPTPTIVPREGESTMQIMVPDRTVGLIIGRGGETIRDLQDRSGCHINIVGPNKSINGLRPVNLIGTAESADHAKTLIMEIVDSDTRGPPGPVDAKQAPTPYREERVQDDKITEVVRVPPEAVGMIIGKSGDTIREMQATTGCKINVAQGRPGAPEIDREINLVGTHQAVEAARAAIMEKVDAVRENRASKGRDNAGDRFGGANYGQNPGAANSGNSGSADPNASTADPYAQWGGYQNYVAMWYTALAQGAGNGAGAPGQPQPPGGSS